MTIDWTKNAFIPSDKKTEALIRNHLEKIKHVYYGNGIREEIVKRCIGKTVLDVGALEHGYDNMHLTDSLFFRIHRVARHVTGIDIIQKDVQRMQQDGYDFLCIDATSRTNLKKRYDVVNIGDVIEHVDSPVALLAFAKRHLKPSGEIFVTTPNPYFIKTIINLLKEKHQVVNFQHVAWFMPCMALELGRRVGLEFVELFVVEPTSLLKRKALIWLPIEFKSAIFMFVYKKVV